jgi:beta-lactamase class A
MRALLLPALMLAACNAPRPHAPRADVSVLLTALRADLDAVRARHPGALIAVSVRDRSTGLTLDLAGDSVLHAASTMKVPVLIELYRQAEAGTLRLDDALTVENRFRSIVDGSEYRIEDDSDDSLRLFLGQPMTLRALGERMITVSSNLATNLLIERLGATRVQATMERLGTTHLRVRRGVEDGKAFAAGLNNVATSRDLAVLLDRLAYGEAVSPGADAAMRAVLLRQRFNEQIPAGLPPGTPVAHKTGWITRHAHDAALVLPPGRAPYVLVVLTRGFDRKADADTVIAEIARRTHARLR